MDYTIKSITTKDVKELQKVSRETFKDTFDEYTAPDDMKRFLKEDYETSKLIKEIENPDSHFFFLMVGDEVAGYLKINVGDAQTEHLKENALEVERIYLLPSFQHKGLGNVLLDYAEDTARKEGYDYMWLGVYEKNINAQHFYKRHSFEKVSEHTFQVGTDRQTDWLLLKNLQ
ncbi:GNAT family N-acetyltransferase [Lactobacillus helveticus]|uniref:GNAT family N-acetyltransferase n=1 Tax=Lactobacillus helveticus TaxID=1587 RepID=UPI000D7C54F4|nr:GNAT family N-acetyltransferase [Lactobacillus helveticus]NRO50873.1 Spermidine/spermine N(1)-acetyltransferase [Lactobacillus helveticus]NRO67778.1 Spermidine/spermine N(1)-acetyltransferase [Lactobacillus helveticus]NRO69667.1 Spermidine/spermine N(1)-acetyltransferase [Lactobacillus helveticus]PXZ20637.1 GNAT family N-acetyltransferase [Lactobacillus helveticus]TLQ20159.1 GNAT family N-acetyltransferase [Lactobacillus helveticus]